jgi:hypothetical protein
MKGKRFTDEQITYALRQAEGGTAVVDVCRQLGVSAASHYLLKKRYGRLDMTEIREMRQLRDAGPVWAEHAKPKRHREREIADVARLSGSPSKGRAHRAEIQFLPHPPPAP